ncbi:MAG TPA: hypothetical protein VKX49_26185 [Bryobacteraceae bacterium]|nr:hypothetical protein [Bryobacteraceae bacterium]
MSAPVTITPIAAGTAGDQLVDALNLRLRAIAAAITEGGSLKISGALDMGGFGIVNLADPVAPTDALNLRSADKRYAMIGGVKQAASVSITSGGGVTVASQTLTAATTINTPAPVAQGNILVVLLLQDPTGGHTVTWSNPPFRVSQAHLGGKASTYSILVFTAITDPADGNLKWFLTAIPITNAS